MLTLRRGIARIGWVLLAAWTVSWMAFLVYGRSTSPNPPPLDATLALQIAAFVIGWPLAIFLLWRLLLWIGQGFWQTAAEPVGAASKHFQLDPDFWTARTMALLGAVLFVAFGIFAGANGVGGFVANAAIGAIFGAVIARFMPRRH